MTHPIRFRSVRIEGTLRAHPTGAGNPVLTFLLGCAPWFLILWVNLLGAPSERADEKPRVRAVTAFVLLDRSNYQTQIRDAVSMLRAAKTAYERAGYQVQTIRISTQPFPEYTQGMSRAEAVAFFRALDELAAKENFIAAVGPAMVKDSDDPRQAELLGQILQNTKNLNASLIVAAGNGVHWNALRAAAKLVKFLAENTPHSQANFNFAATALVPPLTPFFPGAYHSGAGHQFAVALESANVVRDAFAGARDYREGETALAKAMREQALAVEAIASRIDYETGWSYVGIDLSPAPLKEVSIAAAIENLTRANFGDSGTLTAAALITSVLRDIPVKHTGYSGLMLPVLEDTRLAGRWTEGALTLDTLLAYSAVCGTGLDVVPLPGEVSQQQLERILGDVASLAVKLHKPLSARLLPVRGKRAGERTEFEDPYLVNATIQPLPR